MNRLKANINALIQHSGAQSTNAFAEMVGTDQSALSRILTSKTKQPRDTTLQPIADYAKVSIEVLKRGDVFDPGAPIRVPVSAYEVDAVDDGEGFDADREAWVESVEIEVSAGNGSVVPEFVPTRSRQRYTLKWFREMGAKPENVKIAGVRGDSMIPTLYPTDRVAINLAATKVVSGRVYVIIMAYESRIKRLFRMADGRIRVVSDNRDKETYPDEFVTDDTEGFKVIGQVIERKGSGGL